MELKEIITLALKNSLITQEQHDEASGVLENKKFTQEDVNKVVQQRLDRVKPQIEELESLKANLNTYQESQKKVEELTNQVSQLTAQLAEKDKLITEKDESIKSRQIEDLIAKNMGDKKILPAYLPLVKRTDNEDELKASIEEVYTKQKEELKASGISIEFGGGANPAATKVDFSKMSTSDLLKMYVENK